MQKTQEIQQEIPPNQKGAIEFLDQVRNYIDKELKAVSIIGPFLRNPFGKQARFSPIDTRPKKDSLDRRIILNLSYPFKQGSVNHSINKDIYEGQEVDLRYPTIDNLARIIRDKGGKNVYIMKRDLLNCYKQFFMDPGDIHLLGYTFKN